MLLCAWRKNPCFRLVRKLDRSKNYFFLLISHKIKLLEVRKYPPWQKHFPQIFLGLFRMPHWKNEENLFLCTTATHKGTLTSCDRQLVLLLLLPLHFRLCLFFQRLGRGSFDETFFPSFFPQSSGNRRRWSVRLVLSGSVSNYLVFYKCGLLTLHLNPQPGGPGCLS